MVVGINSNLAASSASANLGKANNVVQDSIARLSSGNRIIKASDDAAGLAIGTSISTTVTSLEIALLNTEQARSVLQIADGALSQLNDILARQKALATQSNSGSISDTERGYLNQEFTSLTSEIDRIVTNTNFNGITLLDGSLGASNSGGYDSAASTVTFGTTTALYTGTPGTTALNSTPALTVNADADNSKFIGSLADIEITAETFTNNTTAVFQLEFAGVIYRTGNIDLSTADTARTLTFTEVNNGNATIAFSVNNYDVPTATADLQTIADAIEADLSTLTIYQSRTLSTSTTATYGSVTSTTLNGTILEGLDGGDFQIVSSSFDVTNNRAPNIGVFSVTAETATSDGDITVEIGGVSYSTVAGQFNSIAADLNAGNGGGGAGVIRLYEGGSATLSDGSTANPSYLDIDIGSGAVIDNIQLDSAGSAALLQTALNTAFGSGTAGALSFQVGSSVSDKIEISIDSVETTDIYLTDAGASATLSVATQSGAQTAIDVLDNAIATVVSRRADIGASISRFDFAASNIEVSIANQDNARGSFLDADIATESTSFATAQVKLQASVSVLAQANQLPQSLLQLLQ